MIDIFKNYSQIKKYSLLNKNIILYQNVKLDYYFNLKAFP